MQQLLAVFSLTIAALLLCNSTEAQNSCHLRELDLCAASLLVLTQSPSGLATTEPEINKQCTQLKEADSCLKDYTRRCLTPMQRDVLNLATNSSMQMMTEYCTKGSSLRSGYLKHAACLNQLQKKGQKTCLQDLQSSLELFNGNPKTSGKQLQLACCTHRRFESCLGGKLEKTCGKEALNFVTSVVRRATSRMPQTLCRNFKPDGQECKNLLPKSGSTPKGAKSNSILSRLLSAYSGLT